MNGKAKGPETPLDVDSLTREIQEAFAPYRCEGKSVVEELIAERRSEEIKEWSCKREKS